MIKIGKLTCAVFVLCAFTSNLAKSQVSIALDSKIRIEAPKAVGATVVGRVTSISTDTIAVRVDDKIIAFDRSSITRLWRISGERGHMLTGAVIGLPAGALAGWGLTSATCDPGFSELCTFVGLLAGAGVGLIVGGIIGSSTKSGRWEEVDVTRVRVSISVINGKTAGVKLSLKF